RRSSDLRRRRRRQRGEPASDRSSPHRIPPAPAVRIGAPDAAGRGVSKKHRWLLAFVLLAGGCYGTYGYGAYDYAYAYYNGGPYYGTFYAGPGWYGGHARYWGHSY